MACVARVSNDARHWMWCVQTRLVKLVKVPGAAVAERGCARQHAAVACVEKCVEVGGLGQRTPVVVGAGVGLKVYRGVGLEPGSTVRCVQLTGHRQCAAGAHMNVGHEPRAQVQLRSLGRVAGVEAPVGWEDKVQRFGGPHCAGALLHRRDLREERAIVLLVAELGASGQKKNAPAGAAALPGAAHLDEAQLVRRGVPVGDAPLAHGKRTVGPAVLDEVGKRLGSAGHGGGHDRLCAELLRVVDHLERTWGGD